MDNLRKFEKLEKEFTRDWLKRNPLLATEIGLHEEFDEQIPDGSVHKLQDDVRFLHRSLEEFERLGAKGLPPQRCVDLQAAIYWIRLQLHELEDLRLWERIPEAPRVIGECLFQLLSRNYAPLKHRLKLIFTRLEKLPKYIDESRSRLRAPVKTFIENELETITRLPGFFHVLKDVARNALGITPFTQLSNKIEDVHNALEKYSDWLIVDVLSECGDDYPIGEAAFKKLLVARGIPDGPSTLQARAEDEMARLKERLRESARKIKRKASIEDIRDVIRQQHADNFDGVLRFVRDSVQKARQFTTRSGFAELPDGESLYVTETPSYLRHIFPLGGYWHAGRFEEKKEGFYFITPGDCDSDRLKEHNQAALSNLTVHAGYPGHHLHNSWIVRHPSIFRAFWRPAETVEGWAHYCEERVREMGYEDTPMNRFMALVDQHWRAARAVLDVRIAHRKITIPKAVEFLIDETGMDRVTCEAEIRRYITTPTVPLSYLYGKEKIKDLKKWARERMKSRFDEKFFHTAFLKAGALPLSLMKEELEWRLEEEKKKPPVQEKKPAPKAKAKPKPKAQPTRKPEPKSKPNAKAKPRFRGK